MDINVLYIHAYLDSWLCFIKFVLLGMRMCPEYAPSWTICIYLYISMQSSLLASGCLQASSSLTLVCVWAKGRSYWKWTIASWWIWWIGRICIALRIWLPSYLQEQGSFGNCTTRRNLFFTHSFRNSPASGFMMALDRVCILRLEAIQSQKSIEHIVNNNP